MKMIKLKYENRTVLINEDEIVEISKFKNNGYFIIKLSGGSSHEVNSNIDVYNTPLNPEFSNNIEVSKISILENKIQRLKDSIEFGLSRNHLIEILNGK